MANGTPLELIAVEVRADLDQLERAMPGAVRIVDQSMSSVERSVVRAENTVQRSAGAMANAQRNLGRQFADIGAQLAGGQSPFLILAQQAPQVADALTDTGGKAAKVAAFFSGPWGAALLAAGSVVGVLVGQLIEADNRTDGLSKKLEDNAVKARASAEAQRIFETTLYGAADASAKLSGQLAKQNQTQLQVAQSALAAAEALRQSNIQNLRAEASRAAIARRIAEGAADPSNFVQGGTVGGSSGFGQGLARARAQNDLAKATERERVARQGLADAEKAVVQARIPLLDLKAVAASDASAAASQRHEKALGDLRKEYERTGDEAAYLAGRTRIENELSAAQEAIQKRETDARKAGTQAKREAAQAAREAAKATKELERAQRELEQSLKSITTAFDPAKAAALSFRDTIRDIDKLQAEGLLSQIDAISYKLIAAREQAKAVAEQVAKDSEAGFLAVGITKGEMDGSAVREQINRELQMRDEANQKIADDFARKQEAEIRNLAGLYETAFRDGTSGIWSDFKEIGLRVIAETLARFTIAKLAGKGGSILDFGKDALTSVLGFAGGGSMTLGGRGGTDNNRLSLNGKPIANVSRGETLNIGSRASRSQSGANVIQPIIQVDARGAVMNDQFAAMILAKSGQQAQQAAAAMGQGVLKSVPGRMAQYQTDGT